MCIYIPVCICDKYYFLYKVSTFYFSSSDSCSKRVSELVIHDSTHTLDI